MTKKLKFMNIWTIYLGRFNYWIVSIFKLKMNNISPPPYDNLHRRHSSFQNDDFNSLYSAFHTLRICTTITTIFAQVEFIILMILILNVSFSTNNSSIIVNHNINETLKLTDPINDISYDNDSRNIM